MKASSRSSNSQKLVSEVDLARILVARAEGQLATAKEMARLARRRRKEAKQAARRTRKQAKLAKQEVTEAKLVLAKAQARLARLGRPPVKAKLRKTPEKNAAAAPARNTPVRTAGIRSRKEISSRETDVPESQAPPVINKDIA